MKSCVVCGNTYQRAFDVVTSDGQTLSFDSFECAIQRLAPQCAHCGCRIIGHGIEAGAAFYCCAHCARQAGTQGAVDHPQ